MEYIQINSKVASSLVNFGENRVLDWANILTTDSKSVQLAYKEKLGKTFEYLPAPLDPDKFKDIPEVKKRDNQIAYVGRDSYEKGIDILRSIESKVKGKVVYCTNLDWSDAMIKLKDILNEHAYVALSVLHITVKLFITILGSCCGSPAVIARAIKSPVIVFTCSKQNLLKSNPNAGLRSFWPGRVFKILLTLCFTSSTLRRSSKSAVFTGLSAGKLPTTLPTSRSSLISLYRYSSSTTIFGSKSLSTE
jgi:hypothetical protein